MYRIKTYSINFCHFFVQLLVLLPELVDGLCVLFDGGLGAFKISGSVAL